MVSLYFFLSPAFLEVIIFLYFFILKIVIDWRCWPSFHIFIGHSLTFSEMSLQVFCHFLNQIIHLLLFICRIMYVFWIQVFFVIVWMYFTVYELSFKLSLGEKIFKLSMKDKISFLLLILMLFISCPITFTY